MNETLHQTSDTPRGEGNKNNNLTLAYEQLCKSHDAIDSFRSTLLGLLPAASAGGIFLLLNKDILGGSSASTTVNGAAAHTLLQDLLGPIGIFGFVITLGFFAYELYGIRKCHAIIFAAQGVEAQLGITGPFTTRPRELLGFINEPLAAGIIYPAVMAAWTLVGLYFTVPGGALWIAGFVFLIGFTAMLFYNICLKYDAELRDLNSRMLRAEEAGDRGALGLLLDPQFEIVRSDGNTYGRKQYLDDVPAKKNRGRSADQVKVRVGWRKAELTCRVTTTLDAEGKPSVGHFKNTQQFVRRGGEWQCTNWHVMKADDDGTESRRVTN
jgi:hypothetical protein